VRVRLVLRERDAVKPGEGELGGVHVGLQRLRDLDGPGWESRARGMAALFGVLRGVGEQRGRVNAMCDAEAAAEGRPVNGRHEVRKRLRGGGGAIRGSTCEVCELLIRVSLAPVHGTLTMFTCPPQATTGTGKEQGRGRGPLGAGGGVESGEAEAECWIGRGPP
jgi:hypothetical protein